MIELSSRRLALLLALPAVALPAAWSYSHGLIATDECASPAALLGTPWIEGMQLAAEPATPPPGWAFQSSEGVVPSGAPRISPLFVRILRTYDPDDITADALKAFPRSNELAASRTALAWIDAGSERLPVHEITTQAPGRVRIDAYLFFYDSRPVASPLAAMLAGAAARLARGPTPLTIVTVSAHAATHRAHEARDLVRTALASSAGHYRAACVPPGRGVDSRRSGSS